MNVAEWAAWNRDPVGCTVHLIDSGIDTGDILLVRNVDVSNATNVSALRNLLNQNQLELLGEAVRYVLKTGKLPARRPQVEEEGLQYFTFHPTLLAVLNQRLARA
jgi:methionyl-tRNA formyltransferase